MTEHGKTAWRRAASQDDQPLSQRVLSRWDNEGGATPYGPQEAVGDEALAAVGMVDSADRPPHHLSFGQRRRVAAATLGMTGGNTNERQSSVWRRSGWPRSMA